MEWLNSSFFQNEIVSFVFGRKNKVVLFFIWSVS
jgi:hypothetical protein